VNKPKRAKPLYLISKFVYVNAKVSAIGNPFLETAKLEEIIGLKNLGDFKTLLNTYRDYTIKGCTAREIQAELAQILTKFIQMVKEDSPKRVGKFWDSYLDRLEKDIVKRAIYRVMREEPIEEAIPWIEENQLIYEELKQVKQKDLPALLKSHNFPKAITKLVASKPFDRFKFETELEKWSLEKIGVVPLPTACRRTRDKFLLQFRDLLNLKTLLRAKEIKLPTKLCKDLLVGEGWEIAGWKLEKLIELESVEELLTKLEGTSWIGPLRDAFVEYKVEGIYPLEKAADEHFIKKVIQLSIEDNLGIGPGIRFIVGKQYEIQNLKVIVKGIEEAIRPERIRKLLIKVSS
jgi:vacuolar-type H+-ATPase subunit C/Vma6